MLASRLERYRSQDGIVLEIPSGGVPVGYAVSRGLRMPFDLAIARKVSIPGSTEAGYGAVSWNGETALNRGLIASLGITELMVEHGIEEAWRV
ncbi:MAG: hypothetical protein QW057_02840 [Candidatus Bathyarchaeia archaeon]